MSARVALAVSIPQTFQARAVDVGAIRAYLARAEALGFHSAWVVEQVLGSTPSLEPVALLTYAAAVTERLRLGTAVLLTALRSPVHLPIAVDRDKERAGTRLRDWFGAFYGQPQMAEEVSVWGPPRECADRLGEVMAAGARMLMLNPVFDEMEHLEAFASEIAPALG